MFKASTHRVCGSGMGNEMQRKGSNVLLCFWQCGQVREDLLGVGGESTFRCTRYIM